MSKVFLDIENGGLEVDEVDSVEVAWAREDEDVQRLVVPHDWARLTPGALRVNRYLDRGLDNRSTWCEQDGLAHLWRVLDGQTLVCSNPSFDERCLLSLAGQLKRQWPKNWYVDIDCAPWKHRKIDIATYAMPILGHSEPKGLAAICAELVAHGFEVPAPTHGAVDDVIALRAAYRVLEALAKTPVRWVTGMSA